MTKAHINLPTHIEHPGPAGAPYTSAPTRLIELDFELPAGISLHTSLAQSIRAQGLTGAYLRIRNAQMSKLHYVIPDLAPDDSHVAWYSPTHTLAMPGRIMDAGLICGSHGDQPFFHCHGMLEDAAGTPLMGHILPETCLPSRPVRLQGLGFRDARFRRLPDSQTGFELFMPEPVRSVAAANGLLLRITPNTEITAPLIAACQKAGWTRAEVHGLGSIIGAHFADNRRMESFATELLITHGLVDLSRKAPRVDLEIALVGLEGAFMRGRLKPESNPVLITAEIVLKNLSEGEQD